MNAMVDYYESGLYLVSGLPVCVSDRRQVVGMTVLSRFRLTDPSISMGLVLCWCACMYICGKISSLFEVAELQAMSEADDVNGAVGWVVLI